MKVLKICLFLFIGASCQEKSGEKPEIIPHETPEKPRSATETHPLEVQPQEVTQESPPNEKLLPKTKESVTPKSQPKPILREGPNDQKTEPYHHEAWEKWSKNFSKDQQWETLYQESVVHFIKGLQNNLDREPQLMLQYDLISINYGEKMSMLFYQVPEFVEYSRQRFEKSTELANFALKNKARINWISRNSEGPFSGSQTPQ